MNTEKLILQLLLCSRKWGFLRVYKGLPSNQSRDGPFPQVPALRDFAVFILKSKTHGVEEEGEWNLSSPGVMSHEAFSEI